MCLGHTAIRPAAKDELGREDTQHYTKELQGDPRTRGESRTHKTPQVFLCDGSSHRTLLASISALWSGSLETGECHR